MLYFKQFAPGLCLFFCLLTSAVFGQNTFQRTYGEGGLTIDAKGVLATSGGYVMTTSLQDSTPNYHPGLLKINTDGDPLWFKKYGNGIDPMGLGRIIAANDGGFLAIGTSDLLWVILVTKMDANGNLQWQKVIPSYTINRQNTGSAVIAVPGGYIISGQSKRNASKTVLIRIDNQGEVVWSKLYSTNFGDNVLLNAGFVSGDTIFASGARDSLATFSMFDAATGNVLTNTIFEGPVPGTNSLPSMVPAANGDLLLCGSIAPAFNNNPDPSAPVGIWVCRITRTGVVKWAKTYTGVNDRARIVPMTGDNFLLVTNMINGNNINPVLVKINGEGDILWSYQYGGTDYDYFESAVETPDGGVLAVGGIDAPPYNIQSRILIVRTDVNGLVAGCCRQPIDVVAVASSVLQSPEVLGEVAFDIPISREFGQQDAGLNFTISCPIQAPQQNIEVQLCSGDSIVIDGVSYSSNALVPSILHGENCDTTVFYNIQVSSRPTLEKTIVLCPGDSITINGTTFNQSGTFTQVIPSVTGGCDTSATYIIQAGVNPTLEKAIFLCPGDSITIDGTTFKQSGTFIQTVSSITGGCDTLVTYLIQFGTNPTLQKTLFFCPGDSVTIVGTTFTQSGTFIQTLPSVTGGCDTLLTYIIQFGSNPTLEKTISFCPGDSVSIGGTTYTQPTTFVQVVPSTTGDCDTLVTYLLQYTVPLEPTTLTLTCPVDIAVEVPAGTISFPVTYPTPTVQSDCVCPGNDLEQTAGLASGNSFSVGNHTLCFAAQDNCSNQATCCFQVTVTEEDDPCDVKVNGCLKFELLRITRDAQFRKTYHLRVQNNCVQSLTYAAFQLPAGVVADQPQDNTTYVAPSGRTYTVRNPNNVPLHSIRFSAQGTGIRDGEAEVFAYTLPPYAAPDYINTFVKLSGLPGVEVHLNTFHCPVESDTDAANRNAEHVSSAATITVFPNPAENVLMVDLRAWSAPSTLLRVFNVQGEVLLTQETQETDTLVLPLGLPAGVYVLEASALANGRREVKRFVVR